MAVADPKRRFHNFMWPHLATVLRVAEILSGDIAEAEDLAQETMLRAFRGIGGFADGTDAKAWLLTILRRTRIDRLRSPGAAPGRAVSLDALEFDPADTPQAEAGDRDAIWEQPETALEAFSDRQVIAALKDLPEEIRLTLLLVEVEGLELREAATILDVPVGTVKSRTHRGRALLRRSLLPVARELRLTQE